MFSIAREIEKLNYPFFRAKKHREHYDIEGQETCFLGHKLPGRNADEEPDGNFAVWQGFWLFAIAMRPGWALRNTHLIPRWARCVFDKRYRQANRMWLSPTRLLYLVMLELLSQNK